MAGNQQQHPQQLQSHSAQPTTPHGKRTVEVQILGQKLALRTDGDPRRVERLAAYINRKVDEIAGTGPQSSSKLALLAAINIADDYFRLLDESRDFRRAVAVTSREVLAELQADDESESSASAPLASPASATVLAGSTSQSNSNSSA